MLRPDDLEALLAVCMVQGGFAVCAYCSKFCFLARRNPCLESLKLRIGGFFPQRCGALSRRRSHSRRIVPMRSAVTAPDVGGHNLGLKGVLPTLLAVPIPKLTIGSWNSRSRLSAPEGACRA